MTQIKTIEVPVLGMDRADCVRHGEHALGQFFTFAAPKITENYADEH